ncbi:MAG: hypothetical protein IJY95_04150 [Bacteroides sp.]|nr:hypothetical protein [Bacteroides sp.]
MKKLVLFMALLVATCGMSYAQSVKEQAKHRKELRSVLKEKASKDAKKEAKNYKKEGWVVSPGALPLEKQLDRAYMMEIELDDEGYPKYIIGVAQSIGGNYDGARMQALELSKQNLAGQIQTEVTALIENTVANEQLEEEQAATLTKSIMASKNLISQSIGRVVVMVECYRTLKNKNKEVLLRVAYNSDMAKKAAMKAIKKDLESKGNELHNKLDELLGW